MFDKALECLHHQQTLPKDELDQLCNYLFHKQAWHIFADIGLLHQNMRNETAQWRIIYALISQNPQELELLFLQGGMQNKDLLSSFLAEYQLADAFMQNIIRTQNPELWQFTLSMPHFQDNQTNHNDQLLTILSLYEEYMTYLAHWQTSQSDYNGIALYNIAQFQLALGHGDTNSMLTTFNQHFAGRASWNFYDALRFTDYQGQDLPIVNKPFFTHNHLNRPLPPLAGYYGDGDSPEQTLDFSKLTTNFAQITKQFWQENRLAIDPPKIIIFTCPDEHIMQTINHYYDTNQLMLMTDYAMNQDPCELYYALHAIAKINPSPQNQNDPQLMQIVQRYYQSRLAEIYYAATHRRTLVLTHINDVMMFPIWANFQAQLYNVALPNDNHFLGRLYSTEGDIMPFALPPLDNNNLFTRPPRSNATIYRDNWQIIKKLTHHYSGKTIDIGEISPLMGIRDSEIFSKMTNISPYLPLTNQQKGQLHDYIASQNPSF